MPVPYRLGDSADPGQDVGFEVSVLRHYDLAMVGMLYIPREGVAYHWTVDELETKTLVELKAIAAERGVDMRTDNPLLWQKGIINSQRVPVHFASSDIGWGSHEWTTGDADPITPEEMVGIPDVRFPALAVSRQGVRFDGGRHSRVKYRRLGGWEHGDIILQSRKPIPSRITYQVDSLALQAEHMNTILVWMQRKFFATPIIRIHVDIGEPWGFKAADIRMSNIADTSQLTGAANSPGTQRLYRNSFTLEVEGWLPQRTKAVRTVESTSVEVVEESSGEIVVSVTAADD